MCLPDRGEATAKTINGSARVAKPSSGWLTEVLAPRRSRRRRPSGNLAAWRRYWRRSGWGRRSGLRRSVSARLRTWLRRLRPGHANQFRYGDELKTLGFERIESRGHCFDYPWVNVGREHDRTERRLHKNTIANNNRAGQLPVIRDDIAQNDPISELIV